MKVGDLVKHTPWNDVHVGWINRVPDFNRGLVVESREDIYSIYYLVNVSGEKHKWYRGTELQLISEICKKV
jgi:hypothetical protein